MSITRNITLSRETEGENGRSFTSCWELTDCGKPIVSVKETAEGKNVQIVLKGNLRSDTASFFIDELYALATADCEVTLDCEALTDISNACQLGLIDTQQMMDKFDRGMLTLTQLPPSLMDDFQASGVAGALMIE